jgi:hypothetical protein
MGVCPCDGVKVVAGMPTCECGCTEVQCTVHRGYNLVGVNTVEGDTARGTTTLVYLQFTVYLPPLRPPDEGGREEVAWQLVRQLGARIVWAKKQQEHARF